MRVYTFSEARQQLSSLLKEARRNGKVRIRRRDGEEFTIRPAAATRGSPLDLPGLDLRVPVEEIVAAVRESRRSTERLLPPNPAKAKRMRLGSRSRARPRETAR